MGLVLIFSLFLQDCSKTSTGFTPLNDLGTGTYQGHQGGLYPGGTNNRPSAHEAAGLTLAAQIKPVTPAGTPDPANGKIGMASIGMSNTNQEFQLFMSLAGSDPTVNKRLVFVNGAEPSRTAEQWADPNHWVWSLFANKLSMAGLSPQQLQAVWIKLVAPSWMIPSTFPDGALQVEAWLKKVVQNVKAKYPSVKIAYLSSRIYGHYATITLSSEPYAYENGFSVKWLIEKQLSGDPDLVYDGPSPKAPWLSWGPYLWADGVGPDGVPGGAPGRSDGLEWKCGDFVYDGTHPSNAGALKVAQMLLNFLKSDVTSAPWFLASVSSSTPGGGSSSGGSSGGGGGGACGLLGIEVVLLLVILGGANKKPSALLQEEIEYAPGLKLDLYKPKGLSGKVPAIVFIHGGGWEGGDKRPMPLALEANKRGYVAISINYRLSGEAPFPAAVEDCREAVKWLRKQPYVGRIGAWGHSAGGHLALMLGCTDEEKVHAVVAWSAPTDLSKKFAEREIRKFLNGADPAKASPITFVTKDDAPALMAHGDRDAIVPVEQAHLMHDKMKEVGCEVELVIQKNGGHAFEGIGVEPSFTKIVEASFEFLNRHLTK